MSRRLPIIVGSLAILVAGGGAGATPSATATGASARASAIRVVAPGQSGGGTREVVAPPQAVLFVGGFAYPEDGSIMTTGGASASASASGEGTRAQAAAASEVSSVSLFGGEVTVARVTARASASATSGRASGDTSQSAVSGLVVAGQPVDAAPGAKVALGDWGYALVLAQGSAPSANGHRSFVTGLEIHVTADHGGLPAGSSIVLGYGEAAAAAAPAAAQPRPARPAAARAAARSAPRARSRRGRPARPRAERPRVPPLVRRPSPLITPRVTRKGYVFPVHGPASFTSTFAAARASTGWHHGEDIFAPMGAPVLAVARGTVFSVGWNDIGGNRLWLRDRQGNEFYYAHLSAFSPLAVEGAQVRAGDVLGFVGTSGDAEGTPPHLHFEFHPVGLLALGYDGVVDPYPHLLAWQRAEDVRFLPSVRWLPSVAPVSDAPTPGAFLLSSSDISAASGLDRAALARALRERVSGEAPLAGAATAPSRSAPRRPSFGSSR